MRKKSIINAGFLCLLLGAFAIAVTSCKKQQVRKKLAGTWNITEVTIDGTPYPGTVSGTITFETCSGSENRKGACNAIQEITLTQSGISQTETANIPYRILKKGERIFYDDSEIAIHVDDDNLTMTFNESSETIVWKLTKQ